MMLGQTPAPIPLPPAFDPNRALIQVLDWVGPIALLIVAALAVRWVFRSTVGDAIAERIRARRGGRHGWGQEEQAVEAQRVAQLEEQVVAMRGEIAELAERLDFAERLLAERREQKQRLGAGQ